MNVIKLCSKCRTRHEWIRESLSEFVGTFLLMFIGLSSVAQSVLSEGASGQVLSINLGFGFAVALAILVSGNVSGAHLNPAVTVSLAFVGKFPHKKIFHYLLAQYLGSFVGAVCTYLVYYDALNNYDGGVRSVVGSNGTASIWTTYPREYLSLGGAFFDQVMGTFVLMLVVCGITDSKNMQVQRSLYPLYIGITVITIGLSLGHNCGYAINPARDLSPRIFLTIAGWGKEAFLYRNYWWVPIAGPHLGAILGALLYVVFIEVQISKVSNELELKEKKSLTSDDPDEK